MEATNTMCVLITQVLDDFLVFRLAGYRYG